MLNPACQARQAGTPCINWPIDKPSFRACRGSYTKKLNVTDILDE